MANEAPTLTGRGLEVQPEKIDKALKQLWEDSEGVSTRASLMNLAVYSEAPDALETNSDLVAELTRDHACRAILINSRPDLPDRGVQSWINAHCHISKAGAKQVCCEEISFLLQGKAAEMIANVVFSHLDSDLPLVFWWQGELHELADEHFWSYVDRLIVDSRDWHSPRTDFAMLRSLEARHPKLIVRDLNWTRFLHMRQATAKIFDHPEALVQLQQIDRMRIEHGPRHRLTSYLLIGWLASQLGWTLGKYTMARNELQLRRDDGKTIEVTLGEAEEPIIRSLVMEAGETGAKFSVELTKDRDHYNTVVALPDREPLHRVLPAGEGSTAYLVNQELVRGSRHKIFSQALDFAEPLF